MILNKKVGNAETYLNVHLSYRMQLKAFSKSQFDPFRRDEKKRIIFQYDPDDPSKCLETTVGQLNFFKWAIEAGVVFYINNNRDFLEKQMRHSCSRVAIESSSSPSPIDYSKLQQMKTRDCATVVTFD